MTQLLFSTAAICSLVFFWLINGGPLHILWQPMLLAMIYVPTAVFTFHLHRRKIKNSIGQGSGSILSKVAKFSIVMGGLSTALMSINFVGHVGDNPSEMGKSLAMVLVSPLYGSLLWMLSCFCVSKEKDQKDLEHTVGRAVSMLVGGAVSGLLLVYLYLGISL